MSSAPTEPPRKTGAIVSVVVTVLALAGVTMAFLSAASPYVTLAEARTTSGDRLYLAGDMVKGSLRGNVRSQRFSLKDANGEVVEIVYDGAPPSNLAEATRVVAIGKLDGGAFRARDLLVKCPSKYEGDEKA